MVCSTRGRPYVCRTAAILLLVFRFWNKLCVEILCTEQAKPEVRTTVLSSTVGTGTKGCRTPIVSSTSNDTMSAMMLTDYLCGRKLEFALSNAGLVLEYPNGKDLILTTTMIFGEKVMGPASRMKQRKASNIASR
jgi:hypothetical protein